MTMASVDCSGCSWNSSLSCTPIRSGSRSSAILARSSRFGLAREAEPGPLVARVVEDDQVVALGDAGEVAVHDGRFEQVLGLQLIQPAAQARPPLGLDQLLVRGPVPGARLLQAPLALEEGAL